MVVKTLGNMEFPIVKLSDLLKHDTFIKNWYQAYKLHGGDLSLSEYIAHGKLPFGKQVLFNNKYYSYTVILDNPQNVKKYSSYFRNKNIVLKYNKNELEKHIVIVHNEEESIEKGLGSKHKTTDYTFSPTT